MSNAEKLSGSSLRNFIGATDIRVPALNLRRRYLSSSFIFARKIEVEWIIMCKIENLNLSNKLNQLIDKTFCTIKQC